MVGNLIVSVGLTLVCHGIRDSKADSNVHQQFSSTARRQVFGLYGHWDAATPAAANWPIAVRACVKLLAEHQMQYGHKNLDMSGRERVRRRDRVHNLML